MTSKALIPIFIVLLLLATTAPMGDATGSVTISGHASSKLAIWDEAAGMVPEQTTVVDRFALASPDGILPQKSTVLGVRANVMKWYVKAQASLENVDTTGSGVLSKVAFSIVPLSAGDISIPSSGGTLADFVQKRVICKGTSPTEHTVLQTNYRLISAAPQSLVAVVRYSIEPNP